MDECEDWADRAYRFRVRCLSVLLGLTVLLALATWL